jgi:hypothetical protein
MFFLIWRQIYIFWFRVAVKKEVSVFLQRNIKNVEMLLHLEVRDIAKLLLVAGNGELALLEHLFNVLGHFRLGNNNIVNL